MRASNIFQYLALYLTLITCASISDPKNTDQLPLLHHGNGDSKRPISTALFNELEELARIVDIAYCVGGTSLGIVKPFKCLSRCSDFPSFDLVTTWHTGPMLSDSCGYIALDHAEERIIVAFRGTYSVANTVVDLSTVPQEYVPYPGEDDGDDDAAGEEGETQIVGENVEWETLEGAGGYMKREVITEPSVRRETKCKNCTVHMGFHRAWLHTRDRILSDLTKQVLFYPSYELNLVGHSLGGAVAALAALDLQGRGWNPLVTTFGEPRVGNAGLVKFLDSRFNLTNNTSSEHGNDESDDTKQRYRRVTHIDDPVPLLPLSEWSFAMHAGEIFISKSDLSPLVGDLQHCEGDVDPNCIAGQDSTATPAEDKTGVRDRKRDLLESVKEEVHDVLHEPWGIPSRYKLWQLFFAHRDYFWRLGLCVPSADSSDGRAGGLERAESEGWKGDLR